MGDEIVANVLDGLCDRIEEDDFGGKRAGRSNHGYWIDDRNGVKEGLNADVPDRCDVTIFNIDSPQ